MRRYRSLSCNMRKKIFVSTIPTSRTSSVTNITSLVFIFFMSDIRNADTFDRVLRRPAELAFRRNGDTLSSSPRKYYSGRTCSLVDPRSVVHLTLKCSDIFEHVGLRTLLDDSALLQIAQDATDILARHPGHGSQVLPADPLVEQNASTTRILADMTN